MVVRVPGVWTEVLPSKSRTGSVRCRPTASLNATWLPLVSHRLRKQNWWKKIVVRKATRRLTHTWHWQMYRLSHYANIHPHVYIQISISFNTSGTLCSHMFSFSIAEVRRESTKVGHPRRHRTGERSLQNAPQSRSLPEPDCCPMYPKWQLLQKTSNWSSCGWCGSEWVRNLYASSWMFPCTIS